MEPEWDLARRERDPEVCAARMGGPPVTGEMAGVAPGHDPHAATAAFDPECPVCSGKVAPDDPAVQALEWGMMEAESKPGLDPFWKAAVALESARTREDASVAKLLSFNVSGMVRGPLWAVPRPDPDRDDKELRLGGEEGEVPAGPCGEDAASPEQAPLPPHDDEVAEQRRRAFEDVLRNADNPGHAKPYALGEDAPVSSSLKTCKVKTWNYPKPWRRYPAEGYLSSENRVGVEFCAEVIFEESEKHACKCCVFRQFLKQYPTTEAASPTAEGRYSLDMNDVRQLYGGAREDRTGPDAPDNPDAEAGIWGSNGCRLAFHDRPSTPFSAGEGVEFGLSLDFIGAVYDRCRNWRLVDARRALFWLQGQFAADASDRYAVYYESVEGRKNVDPETGAETWNHRRALPNGDMRPMPGESLDPDTSHTMTDADDNITSACS